MRGIGKKLGIKLFSIGLALVVLICRPYSAVAQQTLAEKLLEIMWANHQITEEQYRELKKEAEAEKAAQAAGIASQVRTETKKIVQEKKPAVEIEHPETGEGVVFNMKGITVNLGGFLEAAGIYRGKNLNSDLASPFNHIPLANQSNYFQDEFRFSARQSRLSLLVQGDYSPTVHLGGYYEMDFLGAANTATATS